MIDCITHNVIIDSEQSSHKYHISIDNYDEEVNVRIETEDPGKFVSITFTNDGDQEVNLMSAFDFIEAMELILAKAKKEGKDGK